MKDSKMALVCLSGGLDSTVSLYWSLKNYEHVAAVFFDYGQKALKSEKKTTEKLCEKLNLQCYEVSLKFVSKFSNSSLNKEKNDLPQGVDLSSEAETKESAKSVWVPNRNGLFINAGASVLESQGGGDLILGFNLEEAETFPDNSKDFLKASNKSLEFSTQGRVKLASPTLTMTKKEIYKLGLELGFDPQVVWPCYESGDKTCGLCESCLRFNRARKEVEDLI